ncbi:MAG: acylphosphatase [Candidatus Schekmanbacteria bacterium RIFCSPHIGHO2_02_FULL_38_11]|uniref:acylphosphatase n=1 Tax=Candidatus Schekmanbacteria bacterium RIFCSPLOWO2_12_FULL_38_15 TaxID=1817883 RepID=A0A1F7SNW4_9BACT|nr:MAG: acylphosphatase [Candidatus Schekmanbacteria bacterium GWA2_38_9]OGL50214.1 MAG: acylphosphatase [Candidatus Schekmanbacteria bacterium RIFCSPLOWO2_02_FULL_38_14]OGL55194.1 MAG: acylphosphatase [Candidatus Schekmanbacteria bacterium RIFCSPHIGHO2_02_FULL_38_11]OGL55475.1 MAG: acylphosphatase [Candidatus Schekmanbacteria bacterium RIFCSPLOWO2_12_FULL_38_15]
MNDKVRIKAVVKGFVQGVGYRYFTVREAANLGLNGHVKNLYDGNVETVAEGEKKEIEKFILRLKKGPSLSKVTDVEVVWEDYRGEYKGFDIKF